MAVVGGLAASTFGGLAVLAQPAAADGVYLCYYPEQITVFPQLLGGVTVPYVVPASVTTQPQKCPAGTIAVGA
jgi:hypothetical protein